MALPSLLPGALFGARWIVGRVLGKNELAVVYEAEEASEARFAALKILDSAFARDGAAWTHFESMTRSLAQIPGDGIARSYDVGMNEGRPFVATERSVFPTLSRYVAERGALSTRAFRETLGTLASALDAAHGAGIIHGNLKPQNVFVSVDKPTWVRLTDFGFAELRVASGVNQPRTLGWNAPEVSPDPPTGASDLYALGLLCFFALSGSPWFSAQRSSTASGVDRPKTASERARAFGGDIPVSLDAWFERALARNPAERFPNAIDMAHAFARALDGQGQGAPVSIAPLSATIPVPERSPFARGGISPFKVPDPNAPTDPQFQPTVPVAARDQPGGGSTPPQAPAAHPSATRVSVNAPTQPVSTPSISVREATVSTNAPPPSPSTPPERRSVVVPPTSVIFIVLGAFVLGVVAIATLAWVILRSR